MKTHKLAEAEREIDRLRKINRQLLKTVIYVRDYSGGSNIFNQELCPFCHTPDKAHDRGCPMLEVKRAITLCTEAQRLEAEEKAKAEK